MSCKLSSNEHSYYQVGLKWIPNFEAFYCTKGIYSIYEIEGRSIYDFDMHIL